MIDFGFGVEVALARAEGDDGSRRRRGTRSRNLFDNNSAVAFADINLSEVPIYENYRVAWPAVCRRSATRCKDYEGAPYQKKTSAPMCTELGSEENDAVKSKRRASTCLLAKEPREACNEKEVAYIAKMKAAPAADVAAQLTRLQGMPTESMKADLLLWLRQRVSILKQLSGRRPRRSELEKVVPASRSTARARFGP